MKRIALISLLMFASPALGGPFDGDTRPFSILMFTFWFFVPGVFIILSVCTAIKKKISKVSLGKALWFSTKLTSALIVICWPIMAAVVYLVYDS